MLVARQFCTVQKLADIIYLTQLFQHKELSDFLVCYFLLKQYTWDIFNLHMPQICKSQAKKQQQKQKHAEG